MKEKSIARRIALSPALLSRLESEVSRIRGLGSHYRVNESKLASAILSIFFDRYLEKDRETLDSRFVDRKAYLKQIVREASSEEELAIRLNEYLQTSNSKRRRGRKRKVEKSHAQSRSELLVSD